MEIIDDCRRRVELLTGADIWTPQIEQWADVVACTDLPTAPFKPAVAKTDSSSWRSWLKPKQAAR